MTTLVLMVALMVQAQVKIAPKMAKGNKMVYVSEAKSNMGGQVEFSMTDESEYEVVEETADGYVISATTTKIESDAKDNPLVRMMMGTEEVMLNQPILLTTDKDGRVQGIKNYEEVSKSVLTALDKWVDDFYGTHSELAQMMPKEKLKTQLEQSLTEEVILRGIVDAPTSVFALNGLSIQNLSQNTYTNSQNIPMKRMFFIANGGKTITTNSTVDMKDDEVKAFIIKQVEESAPDQAEMVKQNIDAMMASGMLKIEATDKAQYDFMDNGWVKTISFSSDMSMMGQKITSTASVTVKE